MALPFALSGMLGAKAAQANVSPSSTLVEEHVLAQQGFAIALASNVLVTHLLYVELSRSQTTFTPNICNAFDSTDPASGAVKFTTPNSNQPSTLQVSLHYDTACTRLSETAHAIVTSANGIDSVSNLVNQFYTVDGMPNGTLVTTASLNENTFQAAGLGTYTGPSGSNANASLGLTCAAGAESNTLLCDGGIVQDFTSLAQAIGSVTPLVLNPTSAPLTFASPQSGGTTAISSGGIGSLALGYADSTDTGLLVSGGSAYGSDTVSGEAQSLALFPAEPTGWTITDSAHDARFQIQLLNNTTRMLGATVTTISTGTQLASASLDQSGSGTITFSDNSQSNVYNWIIANSARANPQVNLDQHGLTGAWYNPATSGQGFLIETYPDLIGSGQGYLAVGWYTFDVTAAGGQRWYTLQGPATSTAASAPLGIYAATGGNFNAPPKLGSTQVGTATLSFSDCNTGSLTYTFTDGSGRSGTIPLTRLDKNITCGTAGDNGNPASDYLLSGAWYNPSTSGQGLFFDVNPSLNLLFAAWYTYAPNGASIGGGASQRWYTIQDNSFASGTTSASGIPIYEVTGGTFNTHGGASTLPVGTANIVFQSCASATLSYTFTGGTNSGQSSSINLSRVVDAPAGCSL